MCPYRSDVHFVAPRKVKSSTERAEKGKLSLWRWRVGLLLKMRREILAVKKVQ
jgi:hypothetical protein